MKDELLDSEARLQFAGHETFPLRLLWMKKAHDAIAADGLERRTFHEREAIARFGVGKNMALSMRHWAVASQMAEPVELYHKPTRLAEMILTDGGLDPFLEAPATLWLIHSTLAGAPSPCTTFYYAFNLLNQVEFDRESLNQAIFELAQRRKARATAETIKRDVEVFLRSYVSRSSDGEDAAEPLLAELGLIRDARLAAGDHVPEALLRTFARGLCEEPLLAPLPHHGGGARLSSRAHRAAPPACGRGLRSPARRAAG